MHINLLVQNLINPQLTVIWFRFSTSLAFHHILQQAFLNTKFIYFNWRLITILYWFCHTLTLQPTYSSCI